MSAIFILIAGTLTTLFILDFLFFEQWQRPDELAHLPCESSIELHFLLNDDEDRGGLPADDTCDIFVIWNPDDIDGCRLSVSPVRDDMNEFAGETAAAAKLIVVIGSFLSIDVVLTSCW